jgi:hypothetical protein
VALQGGEVLVKHGNLNIPVGRILRLLTKTLRMSKDGLDREERRELGIDLLLISAHILEGIELDDRQMGLFDAVADTNA